MDTYPVLLVGGPADGQFHEIPKSDKTYTVLEHPPRDARDEWPDLDTTGYAVQHLYKWTPLRYAFMLEGISLRDQARREVFKLAGRTGRRDVRMQTRHRREFWDVDVFLHSSVTTTPKKLEAILGRVLFRGYLKIGNPFPSYETLQEKRRHRRNALLSLWKMRAIRQRRRTGGGRLSTRGMRRRWDGKLVQFDRRREQEVGRVIQNIRPTDTPVFRTMATATSDLHEWIDDTLEAES